MKVSVWYLRSAFLRADSNKCKDQKKKRPHVNAEASRFFSPLNFPIRPSATVFESNMSSLTWGIWQQEVFFLSRSTPVMAKKRGQPLDGETQAAGRACFVRQDSEVQCSAWDRGWMYPFVFIWEDRQTGWGWGIYPGGVGGAGPPVKWPRGDLKCIWGPPQKPGKVWWSWDLNHRLMTHTALLNQVWPQTQN